jgi:hypothetical protein
MYQNRAARRANNAQVAMFTEAQVREMIKRSNKQVLKKLADDYSAVLALCLRDRLGFGRLRAHRFLVGVTQMFEDLNADRLSLEDIKQTIDEELGIKIK